MSIELDHFVTRRSVEEAYRTATRARTAGLDSVAKQGLRAAKDRNPKLLKALQLGASILQRMSEEQAGMHGFDVGGIRVQHTEFALWKNAYSTCDAGNFEACKPYVWIYAMAGILAGVIT